MKTQLAFEFTIDKTNQTVQVKRQFAANLDLVWDAWTKPEILDQWWAPKPYMTHTVSMDFKEGGTWLYYMESPEGDRHYCKNDYKTINPKKNYSGLDAFCDEKGKTNMEMPRTLWENHFTEENGMTTVNISAKYESLESLEMVIEMGFKEGFTMALSNLDEYLEKL